MLSKLLSLLGCEVTGAATVKDAMSAAKYAKFDLLVSDIGLPDGSGMDIMRALSAEQNVKGIALSGFGQDEDLRRSREAGFSTHLTKPVNLDKLNEVIRELTR